MRSLAVKLTLAFLLVGIIGVVVFALLLGQRTQGELDRFLSARDQSTAIEALNEYYARNGSWDGVRVAVANSPYASFFRRALVLANRNGLVLVGNTDFPAGAQLPPDKLSEARVLSQGNEVAGYVLFTPIRDVRRQPQPALELELVQRIGSAALVSAGITALVALLVGGVLARTLTRPLSELTAATRAMAGGELKQQVAVRSQDEIGQLAGSFNQMSTDLARNIQSRKQMTADLAHDLRTPLSILRGYTEGLKDGRIAGNAEIYDVMHGEVEHLQQLVDDLRTLSLADAGELALNKRAVDPKALLERTGLAYVVQAEQKGVALEVDAPENLPSIDVDTARMTQVLNNLVSNALRHTSHGKVVLSAVATDGRVRMSVRDTGSGIAPEHLPFVFDRFYRADPSRQRSDFDDGDSTGLGLAIAKAIVETHGGAISVSSVVGEGTLFTVEMPAR